MSTRAHHIAWSHPAETGGEARDWGVGGTPEPVGVRVIVRGHTVQNDPQDLVDALIAITPAFSAWIDGQRGGTQFAATGRQAIVT